MANTYINIATTTLGSSQATVTLSSIPQTFNNLVLRISARSSIGGENGTMRLRFNGDTATNYSEIRLFVDSGTVVASSLGTNVTANQPRYTNGNGSTVNTFSNYELFIPNYTATTSRQMSHFGVAENNTIDAGRATYASLYRGTSAISSIEINANSGTFNAGSSFYLYGIKNS